MNEQHVPEQVEIGSIPSNNLAINIESFPKIVPGGSLRFQVRHSYLGNGSSWKVRTSKNYGDVYVIHRESGRWIKASFHEEVGRSHYAVSKAGQKLVVPNEDPYLSVSYDRQELLDGWFHGKRIIIAKSELRTWAEPELKAQIMEIDFQMEYDAIAIDLLLGKPLAKPLLLKKQPGRRILAVFGRSDGGTAVLISTPVNLEYKVQDLLRISISEAKEGMRAFGWDGTSTRLVIMMENDEFGTQKEIEVAIDE